MTGKNSPADISAGNAFVSRDLSLDDLRFPIAFGIGIVFFCGVLTTVWLFFTLTPVEEGAAE